MRNGNPCLTGHVDALRRYTLYKSHINQIGAVRPYKTAKSRQSIFYFLNTYITFQLTAILQIKKGVIAPFLKYKNILK